MIMNHDVQSQVMVGAKRNGGRHKPMITNKQQMLRHCYQCEQKFQVNVCDNMLREGRMTKATIRRSCSSDTAETEKFL